MKLKLDEIHLFLLILLSILVLLPTKCNQRKYGCIVSKAPFGNELMNVVCDQALDLVPTKLHERSPIFLGSYDEVEEIKALYAAEGEEE